MTTAANPENLAQLLQSAFGFARFRANQEAVCRAAIDGRERIVKFLYGVAKGTKKRPHEPIDRLLPELTDRRVLRRIDGPLDDTVPANRPITVEDLLTFRMGYGMVIEPTATPPFDPPFPRSVRSAEKVGSVLIWLKTCTGPSTFSPDGNSKLTTCP